MESAPKRDASDRVTWAQPRYSAKTSRLSIEGRINDVLVRVEGAPDAIQTVSRRSQDDMRWLYQLSADLSSGLWKMLRFRFGKKVENAWGKDCAVAAYHLVGEQMKRPATEQSEWFHHAVAAVKKQAGEEWSNSSKRERRVLLTRLLLQKVGLRIEKVGLRTGRSPDPDSFRRRHIQPSLSSFRRHYLSGPDGMAFREGYHPLVTFVLAPWDSADSAMAEYRKRISC